MTSTDPMTSEPRLVGTALGQAGDFAGAATWRRAFSLLGTGLRIAVCGVSGRAVQEATRGLPESLIALPIHLDAEDPDAATDPLLTAHAMIWLTSATGALPASERAAMHSLEDTAPALRFVVLTDVALVAQVVDDADAALASVRDRVRALLPDGWALTTLRGDWTDDLHHKRRAITQARRDHVARLLLDAAAVHTTLQLADLDSRSRARDSQRSQADTTAAALTDRARRAAGHLVGAIERQTTALLADWSAFLYALDVAMPHEMDAIGDVAVLRRTLPRWLDHVVSDWITRRLDQWRADLADDLDGLVVDAQWRAAALLVAPAVHPGPVRAEGSWRHRIATTAALGAGVALLTLGWTIPGLAAATGGVALGLAPRPGHEQRTRADLLVAARQALGRVGHDGTHAIRAQLSALRQTVTAHRDAAIDQALGARDQVAQALEAGARDANARRQTILTARTALQTRLKLLNTPPSPGNL